MKEKNAEIVLILGNGFDLDLGLKSSYNSFAKSKEFNRLLEDGLHTFFFKGGHENESLLYHFQRVNANSNWFDLEEEIYRFIEHHQEVNDCRLELIEREFENIKAALSNYLNRMVKEVRIRETSFAKVLFTYLISLNKSVSIYSFNYTDCFCLCGCTQNEHTHLWNIHGKLDENIVLGYDNYKNLNFQRKYEFLDKSLMLEASGFNLYSTLRNAKEVIFFGHSINDMDFSYFDDYFKYVSSIDKKNQTLTFVCLDNESEFTIKSNIKNKGYDWRTIKGHLNNVDFIHTYLWNEGNTAEYHKLHNRIGQKDN